MDILNKINPNNLHHGYLIMGDREVNKQALWDFLAHTVKVKLIGNPDVLTFDFNTLTIDEARDIALMQARKGFAEDSVEKDKTITVSKKIFIISTNIITDEAQNALLKVFEEPTPGTHFFILASQNTFLPTFLSRLHKIQTTDDSDQTSKFLTQTLSERLAFVTKLAGEISDEKKVKQDAINLVNQIESELYNSVKVGPSQSYRALKECQFARNALFSRGAMIKMILENLMLQI